MGESSTPGSKVTMSRYLATGGPFRSTGSGARSLDADTLGTEPPPVSRHRPPDRSTAGSARATSGSDRHPGELFTAFPEQPGQRLVLRPRAELRLADRTAGLPEAGRARVRARGRIRRRVEDGLGTLVRVGEDR